MAAKAKARERYALTPIDKLIPYARNSRTHSDAQVRQIAGSIEEFGFTNNVLWDELGIIAGHGRVLGAELLWSTGKAVRFPDGEEIPKGFLPTTDCAGWSEAKRKAYIIADNQLALNAGWDMGLLSLEFKDLDAASFDLLLTGFDPEAIAAMLAPPANEGDGDADAEVEPPMVPVSVAGDIWELGQHRIICGDSTKAEVVEAVLKGVKPLLMVTDPPYGVEYDASWRKGLDPSPRSTGKVENDDRADWREAWALFPGEVAYVWCADRTLIDVGISLRAAGFQERSNIIWKKPQFVISRGHYHPQHEIALYAVRKDGTAHWHGDRKQATVWEIANNVGTNRDREEKTGHSTQKPVECMRRPIENNSSPGQAVYEPFSGSGSTIIACEQTGRSCFAIEIEPAYVDVAICRWANFTSKTPVLVETGETYAEVAARRLPTQTPKTKIKKDA